MTPPSTPARSTSDVREGRHGGPGSAPAPLLDWPDWPDCENIPALPASDWSVVRIHVREEEVVSSAITFTRTSSMT
eukprot:9303521-Pyramimonas_sp.AAC.1